MSGTISLLTLENISLFYHENDVIKTQLFKTRRTSVSRMLLILEQYCLLIPVLFNSSETRVQYVSRVELRSPLQSPYWEIYRWMKKWRDF